MSGSCCCKDIQSKANPVRIFMHKYILPFECLASLSPLTESLPRIQRVGAGIGRLLWFTLPMRRKLAQQAVQVHLKKSPEQARHTAYQSFLHTGRSFVEVVASRNIDYRFMNERVCI